MKFRYLNVRNGTVCGGGGVELVFVRPSSGERAFFRTKQGVSDVGYRYDLKYITYYSVISPDLYITDSIRSNFHL